MVKIRILLVLLFFYSCGVRVPHRVKKNFSFCYSERRDFIKSPLRFDGYYVNITPFNRPHYDWKLGTTTGTTLDTLYSNILFFPDGIFVKDFKQLGCGNCDIESNTQFLKDVAGNKEPHSSLFYSSFIWGIYKIEGDTIRTQSLNSQEWPNPYWYLIENIFLISETHGLTELYRKDLLESRRLQIDTNSNYNFVKTDVKLPSSTWLKEEKWFWCFEEEFKQWNSSSKNYDK